MKGNRGLIMFEYKRKVNYYETDKMGVVHHSNYIRYLEEARCSWLEEIGMPMEAFEARDLTIPVLGVEVEYKNHITSGDVLIIRLKVTEFNGVRMTVEYETEDAATGKPVISARTRHCFTNSQLRPVSLKKYSREIYEKFMDLLESPKEGAEK